MIKSIIEYPNYLISENGEVFRKKDMKLIKTFLNKTTGYQHINLYKNKKCKTFQLHRLVALNFIPNYENKKCVNHKDSNRLNNHVNNLEWVTHSENNKHAYSKGYKRPPSLGKFGINNYKSKTVIGLSCNGDKIIFYSLGEATRNGFFESNIIKAIKTGKFYKNYFWSYYN